MEEFFERRMGHLGPRQLLRQLPFAAQNAVCRQQSKRLPRPSIGCHARHSNVRRFFVHRRLPIRRGLSQALPQHIHHL